MNVTKNIVIVNQDAGYLMIDVANAFRQKGYEVTLITGRLVKRTTELADGVEWKKIIKYQKNNQIQRLFTWLFATFQIWFLLMTRYPKSEVFFVSNPPFAPLLSLLLKNKFSVLVYDVYPDALVDARIIKSNSFITKWWGNLNRKVFAKSQKVFTITNGMKQTLVQYVEESKIQVVPIWADNESLKPISRENNVFVKEHGLTEKFIVLYSGNLAKTGDADIMIDLARKVSDDEILFLIIGDGVKRDELKKQIKEYRLTNCILLPWQNPAILAHSLSCASLAVVSLGKEVSKIAMPSKLYSYLAVGAPVLSIAADDSDLAKLVNFEQIGKNFDAKAIDEICQFISKLKSDSALHDLYHNNSLQTAQLFTKENANKFIV